LILLSADFFGLLKLSRHSDARKIQVISLRTLDSLALKVHWVNKVSNLGLLEIVKETLQGVVTGMLKVDSASGSKILHISCCLIFIGMDRGFTLENIVIHHSREGLIERDTNTLLNPR